MKRDLTILLIEDDETACAEIIHYIDTLDDVCLSGVTNRSDTAIELVTATLPDAVILDLELHQGGGNGLTFLHNLNQLTLSKRPYILITTNNSSNFTHESARKLDADFIMTKYEVNYNGKYVIDFLQTIRDTIMSTRLVPKNLEPMDAPMPTSNRILQRIHRELNLIGISPKAIGFQYLTDAILLVIQNTESRLPKILAKKYKKSDTSIERAMQNAINRAWRTNDPDELLHYYTARINPERGVPTTTEFVFYYASMIKTDF